MQTSLMATYAPADIAFERGAGVYVFDSKGKKYLDFICQRISDFLIELAGANINDHFPHAPQIKH